MYEIAAGPINITLDGRLCYATAGIAQIAPCLSSADQDIRRLAVGSLLALLVDLAGKEAAIEVGSEGCTSVLLFVLLLLLQCTGVRAVGLCTVLGCPLS